MKITSYVRPLPGIDYVEYLKSQMYDIYGGGVITYIEDSPPHINHGSLRINGNAILFNYSSAISGAREWPWDYSGYTIDMWIKPISYWGNSMLVCIGNGIGRFWANYGGENWGSWNCSLNNVKMKGVPNNKWSRLTLCSDEDNKKLYAFVNGELQVTVSGGNWKAPRFYLGGNDPWNGGSYTDLYLNEIYVTPEVKFTKEFDPYKDWIQVYHSLYTNPDAYGILKKE